MEKTIYQLVQDFSHSSDTHHNQSEWLDLIQHVSLPNPLLFTLNAWMLPPWPLVFTMAIFGFPISRGVAMCSHVHQWNMPVVVAIFHAWSSLPSTCYNQFCCWLHPPTHLVWFPLARFTLENKKNIQLVLFEPRSENQCWQRSRVRC